MRIIKNICCLSHNRYIAHGTAICLNKYNSSNWDSHITKRLG